MWSDWAVLTIESKPDSAIHVELTWDHPKPDVDIHLIRAGDPTDYTSDQDCYYLNCNTCAFKRSAAASLGSRRRGR